jgi:hypothetical protein
MNTSLHFRIFASSENALRSGSFYKVNYYPVSARGIARFINGHYIDLDALESIEDCDAKSKELRASGNIEFTRRQYRQMAP